MTTKITEELDLIRSVLWGYPPCIARDDALRAVKVIQEETAVTLDNTRRPGSTFPGKSFRLERYSTI